MSVELKTHKMLWGRSGNRCAHCRRELVEDATETDDESIIGEECHIVGRQPTSARFNSPLPMEARDKYDNLILMCNVHHKIIDDQEATYTVEKLHEMKSEHERWVKESLNIFNPEKQRDDEIYATYIQQWEKYCDVDHWNNWSSYVLGSGQPRMSVEHDKNLETLRQWLLSRVWPRRYPELENSFLNFRRILRDFQETFREHAVPIGAEHKDLETDKFYHLRARDFDQELSDRLENEFDYHVALVQDLMLELTRAGNFVYDMVRKYISHLYRIEEGKLLISSGPYMDLSFRTHCIEYIGNERTECPYPGLEEFKKIRKLRDMHFGEGTSIDDPDFRVGE